MKTEDGKTTIELVIHEGRNREIRKMMEAIGKNIVLLKRVAYGPIVLGGLSRGKIRPLHKDEIINLKAICGGELL